MPDKENFELLSEKLLRQNGAISVVRRYYKGWFPQLPNAVLCVGWTGKETRQDIEVIKPIKTFTVTSR